MCGGYELEADPEALIEAFRVDDSQLDVPLPLEFFPKSTAPIVVARATDAGPRRMLGPARWGLIPHWADSPAVGAKLFNARAEGLAERPAFRDAFTRRRCLVPVSAFYEWNRDAQGKSQRFRVRPAEGRFLALAGLWATWRAPGGEKIGSFTIVTTTPNGLIAAVHDRMPVVLDRVGQDRWLSPETDPDALHALLVPCSESWLTMAGG